MTILCTLTVAGNPRFYAVAAGVFTDHPSPFSKRGSRPVIGKFLFAENAC